MMAVRYWFFEMICAKTGVRDLFSTEMLFDGLGLAHNFGVGFSYYDVFAAF